MNQRGWSLSSYIGYAVILIIFILIIAFNVIKLNSSTRGNNGDNSGTTMNGENKVSSYSEAEGAVVDSLKGYRADKYKKKDIDGTLIVTVNELISGGYLKTIVLDGTNCSGYGVISKNGSSYDYESYVRCGNYTTPGYTSSLDK